VLNRNYVYQGVALLIPFFLSPVVYKGFGASNFGTYSLIITWSTLFSYVISLRSEVLSVSTVNKESVGQSISGSLVIWGAGSIVALIATLLVYPIVTFDGVLEVAAFGVLLGLFSIVNYSLIVRHEFAYTATQLVKVVAFYMCQLLFLYVIEWRTAHGLMFSLLIGVFIAIVFSVSVYGLGTIGFGMGGKGALGRSKRSFPFLVSALLGSSREMLIASFMMFYFDSEVVGMYYFSVLYMTKAFIAYSSIQSNKIRYMAAKRMVLGGVLKKVAFYGVFLFLVVALGLVFISSLSVFRDFDFVLMYALLPVTFTYLVLMPLVSLFEVMELGFVNMGFNFAASGAIAILCFVVNFYVNLSAFQFVLISSFLWMIVVGFQVFYALLVLRQKNCVSAAI